MLGGSCYECGFVTPIDYTPRLSVIRIMASELSLMFLTMLIHVSRCIIYLTMWKKVPSLLDFSDSVYETCGESIWAI